MTKDDDPAALVAEARKAAMLWAHHDDHSFASPDLLARLAAALEAAQAREGRLREALMQVDANTPTQGYVKTVSKRPVAFGPVTFADLQQSLANIGDIARAALGGTP